MPPPPDFADAHARLKRVEQALLDLMPFERRLTVLRRFLAALPPAEARALLADLRRRPDAETWLGDLRDVA